jgi:beta-lactam-binding protein with PASTA domain
MSDQMSGDPGATSRMPRSGPPVLAGSRVVIRVSKGESPDPAGSFVVVPNLIGVPQGEALSALQDPGLTVEVFNDYSASVPKSHVVGSLPHAGQDVPVGSTAVLMVSSGPATAPAGLSALPLVDGLSEQKAVSALQAAGLSPQIVHEFSPNVPKGIVIDQYPNAATASEIPPKKSLMWLWVTIGVVLLLLVGVFAYAAMSKKTATVPNVVGMTQPDAQAAVIAAGFKLGTVGTTQTASADEVGKVVAEDPAPGTQAPEGSPINVIVSGGQTLVPVPAVSGMTQAAAEAALTAAGLTSKVTLSASTAIPKGSVITQAPAAGQQVARGTSIGLVVSQGAGNLAVPAVIGMTQADAQAALKAVGLGAKSTSAYNGATKGDVYSQSPVAGTIVAPGSIINLSISSGPKPAPTQVKVPGVIGFTKADAISTLEGLGFKVQSSQVSTYTAVSDQTPDKDTMADKGSTVKIVIGQN